MRHERMVPRSVAELAAARKKLADTQGQLADMAIDNLDKEAKIKDLQAAVADLIIAGGVK